MSAKNQGLKKPKNILSMTQDIVERALKHGVTGYEFHHNGVEMSTTGLNKILNGTTKKSNKNNLRQMEQYLIENYENPGTEGSIVSEPSPEPYGKQYTYEEIMEKLRTIESKVEKSSLKQDIIFEIIKNAKSAELAYIDKMVKEKISSMKD